jgi:hypothetical protein
LKHSLFNLRRDLFEIYVFPEATSDGSKKVVSLMHPVDQSSGKQFFIVSGGRDGYNLIDYRIS